MKTKAITGTVLTLFLVATIFGLTPVSAAPGDIGNIELNDTTTSLNFYDAGPIHHAWASYPEGLDTWRLTIATSYDALVEIMWFDWYPTNDVYELYVDGALKGTNPAGEVGTVQLRLATGVTHEIIIEWIAYQDGDIIPGGSYYDITFTVLKQYPQLWFKASGGGVSYADSSSSNDLPDDFCTLGLIGMSLEVSDGIGPWVECKGSGTFIDHNKKIKVSFNIEQGSIRRADYLIYFRGTAKVFDISEHLKYETTFRFGLVDNQYSYSNRFDFAITFGETSYYWHGTLLPEGEVTVWVWE